MGRKESNQTKLADNPDWHNILCFSISSWSLFQVKSYLSLSIINYGISKHYAGSQVGHWCPLGYLFLNASSSFLQIMRTTIKTWMSLNFVKISSPTPELVALERLRNLWIVLWPLQYLIFYQIVLILEGKRTAIKCWMGSKFGKIRPGTEQLAAPERLKKSPIDL